jgi:hypothetical protein
LRTLPVLVVGPAGFTVVGRNDNVKPGGLLTADKVMALFAAAGLDELAVTTNCGGSGSMTGWKLKILVQARE